MKTTPLMAGLLGLLLFNTTAGRTEGTPKKSAPPAYKSVWKIDLPEGTRRIGLADFAADKKISLLTMGKDNTLTYHDVSGEKPKAEGTIDLGAGGEKFIVGHFAKGKPSLIVVPGAVHYLEGEKFAKKTTDLKEITGTVRFADGVENIVVMEGMGMPSSFAVDLAGAKPIIAGKELRDINANIEDYSTILVRLPKEALENGPFPEEMKQLGFFAMLSPGTEKKLYMLMPGKVDDGSGITLVDFADLMGGAPKPVWKSTKLAGKVLDVAMGVNPKNLKQTGFILLLGTGEGGKGRSAEFFVAE